MTKDGYMADDSYRMPDEELHAVQAKSLEILVWFVDYCERHGLRVFLAAGTLLGAVRHHGFIPWDDDVDVMMPRPDYERLINEWQASDTSHYCLIRSTEDLVTHDPMMAVCDNLTTAVKIQHVDLDMPQGLVIDVFPLDGCPENKVARVLQVMWMLVYGVFQAQFAPDTHGRLAKIAARAALSIVRGKHMRYRIWRFAERRMTATPYGATSAVKFLYGGPISAQWIIPLEIFDSAVKVSFEGHMLPIPHMYDQMLTIWFGDWRQLPPPEKRHPIHTRTFLDLDTPYEHYKGIEYCIPATT